ncbi:MAG: UPF0261 family protein [Desulfobacca sp.]|nr:UPF0261 family protein [Desulfobacca sp.]
MNQSILIISTLDTKAQETFYLRDRIQALGGKALTMDLSMGAPAKEKGDIPPDQIAQEGGSTIDAIRASRDRTFITKSMTQGAIKLTRKLFEADQLGGIVGLGGATLSMIATNIMRALPFGVPKLMISSSAALPGLSTRYIGTGDIILFHTVIELSGLSPHLCNVLNRAARSVCAMAQEPVFSSEIAKGQAQKQIALSMFGPCDTCAHQVQDGLTQAGYQVIGFHAAGICDRAMEDMINQGFFDAIVDLAPGGVGEELLGGMRSAGPYRLEAAGKMGIPQIIAPSGVNFMSPSRKNYKPGYQERRKYDLDKDRTWLRLSTDELKQVAEVMAKKLNQAKGPVVFLIPTQGWSTADAPNSAAFDPGEDQVFTETLRSLCKPEITIQTVEAYLNEARFAQTIIETLGKLFTS